MPTLSIITSNQEASNLHLQILNFIMLQISQAMVSYLAFSPTIFLPKLFCPIRNITISLGHIEFLYFMPFLLPRSYYSNSSGTLQAFSGLQVCTAPLQRDLLQPSNHVPSHPLLLSYSHNLASSGLFVPLLIVCIPHQTVSSFKAKTSCLLAHLLNPQQ